MAQIPRSLPPTWETKTEFWVLALVQPSLDYCGHVRSKPVHGRLCVCDSLFFSLLNKMKINKFLS